MTILNIDISGTDCRVITIRDTSIYNEGSNIFNGILEVKVPGSDCFIFFDVNPGFVKTLNCVALGICCSSSSEKYNELPDGNYEIRYSVAPNEKMMIEYNHFRNCKQFKKYLRVNCDLWKERCTMTQKAFNKKIEELYKIKELIYAAKYAAEECLNIEDALEKYEDVNNKINSITNEQSCSTC